MFGKKNARIKALEAEKANAVESYAALQKAFDALADDNNDLRHTNYALDRTAATYKRERDEARAELAALKAVRARQNANLKQFRRPTSDASNDVHMGSSTC